MIPSRPDGCLTDFAFDRALAGELGEGEKATFEEHVAACERCDRRLAGLRADQQAFVRGAPPLRLGRARAPWPWLLAGGTLAAAAGVLLSVRGPDRTTRTKGGASTLRFYVSHEGVVRLGAPEERVEPGDALRFATSVREPTYLAVYSVDGARRASVYYPEGPAAVRLEPGALRPLPASTVLDDTLGAEMLYGVFCPNPFDVEPLRRKLETTPEQAPAPRGCEVETIPLRKEARGLR